MPRLGQIIADGLALVLVGAGLTAIVVGYERNLPEPVPQVAEYVSDWADPVTTGSITPRNEEASAGAASPRPNWTIDDMTRPSGPGARVWTDPPRR
ncbi:hypothetical protein [Methylobacterium pseudosasicola]|uniref:Uncharacterized protein n=1 Tax=Methylobacterium pseudosasicola TaxID=582667 RepID=A0A1I4QDR4_9HYPH|nr:hypothetical protein [Methylobacterium pseudosasicola]SFM37763.1 hypothetical protein SAMN05192568_102940 [Methylobacterium pseudosasicola]